MHKNNLIRRQKEMTIGEKIGSTLNCLKKIRSFGRSKLQFLKFGLILPFKSISALTLANEQQLSSIYSSLVNKKTIKMYHNKSSMDILTAMFRNIENKVADCPQEFYDSEFYYIDMILLYQYPECLIRSFKDTLDFFKKRKCILVIDNMHLYHNHPDIFEFYAGKGVSNYIKQYINYLKKMNNIYIVEIF